MPEPSPPPPDPWFLRHPVLALGLTVTVAVGVLVALAEAGLQSRWPVADTAHDETRAVRLRELLPDRDTRVRASEALIEASDGLTGRPLRFQTDDEGFLLPARRHDTPDLTIAFLGGSTTLAEYVADSLRFHALTIDAVEAQTGSRTNALNAARNGNHSVHSLIQFVAKVIPQRPDVVVIMHNVNDLTTLLRVGSYWNESRSRGLVTRTPCATAGCHLALGLTKLGNATLPALSTRLRALRRGAARSEFDALAGPVDSAHVEQQFRSSLETFVETARAWGVAPVLMTQANRIPPIPDAALRYPHDEVGISYARYQSLYDRFNEVVREVAAAHDVPLVDLAPLVPQDREHLYDFVHLTDAGSRRVAEALTDVLLEMPSVRREPASGTPTAGRRTGPPPSPTQ